MWHKVKTTFSAVQFFSAPLQNQGAAKNIGPKPENISEHNKSQTEALLNLSLGEELSRRKLSTPNTSFRWAEVNPGIPAAQDRDYSRYKVSAGQSSSPSPFTNRDFFWAQGLSTPTKGCFQGAMKIFSQSREKGISSSSSCSPSPKGNSGAAAAKGSSEDTGLSFPCSSPDTFHTPSSHPCPCHTWGHLFLRAVLL